MKGLAPHTLQVFEAVSKLDCIKPYLLVGGTALSLQMGVSCKTRAVGEHSQQVFGFQFMSRVSEG